MHPRGHPIDEMRSSARRPGETLEMAFSLPRESRRPGVLLCSPQPMLGGDLDNNVMRTLARGLADDGRAVARFDYRGVGNSLDVDPSVSRFEYWQRLDRLGRFESVLEDAREALARAQRIFDVEVLGGYSFGAWVALELARDLAPTIPLVLVAPPLSRLDFSALERRRGASLLIAAACDALDPPPARELLEDRFPNSRVCILPCVDHFFRDAEHLPAARAIEFLRCDSTAEREAS